MPLPSNRFLNGSPFGVSAKFPNSMPFQPGQPLSTKRRVAITGTGVISPMGKGWTANAEGFRQGRLALKEITLFDTSRQRVRRGGQVDLPEDTPTGHLSQRQKARLDRASKLLLHAANEALDTAGWEIPSEGANNIPLVFGTSAGAMELGEKYYKNATGAPRRKSGQATRIQHYQTQTQAINLCNATGIQGPVTMITNACASGANAVGQAYRLVSSGRADRALCGGYDALCQLVFAGFDSLQALSTTSPRPFDAGRDGLAIGEGAAVFTLEPLDTARDRGATILAEITGYGAATDTHHLTQPNPAGDAALATMTAACREAGLAPGDIGYINSHGTGTPLNDVAEGAAIQRWADDGVARVCVSSTKGAIGHLLGGAGAVESAICLMALQGGWLPPNAPLDEPDPVCTFDLVREPRDKPLENVMTNSFGFGGANATLIFSRPT